MTPQHVRKNRITSLEPIMSQTFTFPRRAPRSTSIAIAFRRHARSLGTGARATMNAWATQRAIRALQSLDDRLLEDIGLPRSEIAWRVRDRIWW
jgi:uncharacterized protein YjiS (DUF1127 family)